MLLKTEQAERFYRIWFAVLRFVNAKTGLIKKLPGNRTTGSLGVDVALKLRDALWDKEELLDQFIEENPARLEPADLALASSWHNKLAGNFYVFRDLKKHTIFIACRLYLLPL